MLIVSSILKFNIEKSGNRHDAIEKLKNFENFDFLYLNKNVKLFNS